MNVTISARLVLRDNYAPLTTAQSGILSNKAIIAETRRQALAAIRAYFHPLMGGPDGQGWRFGRNVYLSEIYQLIDRLPGVDFAENVRFIKPAGDRAIMAGDEVIGVRLYPHELVAIAVVDDPSDPDNFTVAIGQRPGVSQ